MENFTTDEELLKDKNYSADTDDAEDITDEDALEETSEEESEENNSNGDIRTAILMMNELKAHCEKKRYRCSVLLRMLMKKNIQLNT